MGHDPRVTTALERTLHWLYDEDESNNVAKRGNNGKRVEEKNKGTNVAQGSSSEYWVLPEVFNTVNIPSSPGGVPKVIRDVEVPASTKVLCVPASSHASELEATIHGSTRKLTAKAIDRLWSNYWVKMDGVNLEMKEETLDDVDINLPASHPVITENTALGYSAKQHTLSSVMRYAVIEPDWLKKGDRHTVDMYAYSRGDNDVKENPFEVSVRFNVRVV